MISTYGCYFLAAHGGGSVFSKPPGVSGSGMGAGIGMNSFSTGSTASAGFTNFFGGREERGTHKHMVGK